MFEKKFGRVRVIVRYHGKETHATTKLDRDIISESQTLPKKLADEPFTTIFDSSVPGLIKSFH